MMHSLTSSFPLPLQVKCWTRTCATTSVCSFRRARWTTSCSRSYGTTSTCAPSHVSSRTAVVRQRRRSKAERGAERATTFTSHICLSFRASCACVTPLEMQRTARLCRVFFCLSTHRHAHTRSNALTALLMSSCHASVSDFYKTLTHKMSPWQPHQGHLSNPHVTYLVLFGIISLIKVIFPL